VSLAPRKRYEADDDDDGGKHLIAQLLEAISQTDEMQFIRKLMSEHDERADQQAAEARSAQQVVDPETDYAEKMSRYESLGQRASVGMLTYQKAQIDDAERYERRVAAHSEACAAYEALPIRVRKSRSVRTSAPCRTAAATMRRSVASVNQCRRSRCCPQALRDD